MQVTRLDKNHLADYINSDEYAKSQNVAISYHRAVSQLNNPRARHNDILLILAHENGILAGYLGILPDDLFIEDEQIHVGWLSCIWVDEQLRGKGIAKILLEEARQAWLDKLFATEFTPVAGLLYEKLGLFAKMNDLNGFRGYFRADTHRIFPARFPSLSKFKGFLKVLDFTFNILNDIRLFSLGKTPNNPSIRWKLSLKIDPKLPAFLNKTRIHELFCRGEEDFKWIFKYPWVLNGQCTDNDKRYYFTSREKHFGQVMLNIYDIAGNYLAFLILTRRIRHLKVQYAYFEKKDSEHVINALKQVLVRLKCNTLTVFHPWLVQAFNQDHKPFFFTKKLRRNYLVSLQLKDRMPGDYIIQAGDGDAVFT